MNLSLAFSRDVSLGRLCLYRNIYDRSKELQIKSNSQWKYLTLLLQRITCYLTAYFDEKNPF